LPFSDCDELLRDIADAIAAVEAFTAGMAFEDFRQDAKTVAAVDRKLQVISEAAIRLGTDAETRCPGGRHGATYAAWEIGCGTSTTASSCRYSG
jgi:hypothetical protein